MGKGGPQDSRIPAPKNISVPKTSMVNGQNGRHRRSKYATNMPKKNSILNTRKIKLPGNVFQYDAPIRDAVAIFQTIRAPQIAITACPTRRFKTRIPKIK